MIEALWAVEFQSEYQGQVQDMGTGVAVFETQRIFGGDTSYFYIGDYKVDREKVRANVEVTHYAGEPWSIFGQATKFNLVINGVLQDGKLNLAGHVEGQPELVIKIAGKRLASLP